RGARRGEGQPQASARRVDGPALLRYDPAREAHARIPDLVGRRQACPARQRLPVRHGQSRLRRAGRGARYRGRRPRPDPRRLRGCRAGADGLTMLLRDFGTTSLEVSAIGLGCNNFGIRLDRAATANVVHAALDAGITLFDTADIYGHRGASETLLGEALGARRTG